MSDFGLFESDEAHQAEPRLAARTAARKMEAAIDVVRANFGRFLLGATGIDEFGDRWHLSKHDIRAAVEPYVFPNTGTMRRIHNAMKQDWKVAHPYKLSLSHDEAGFGSMPEGDGPPKNLDTDETYHPSSGNLNPSPDWEGYKSRVDQDGPEKVQANDFTPGGDSGSAKHARRLWAAEREFGGECDNPGVEHPGFPCNHYQTPDELEEPRYQRKNRKQDKEAARLVADIYTDFARANGLRVASLDTLDIYASTGIHEADYRLLQSMIVRAAEEKDEESEDDDTEEEDDDSEGGEAPDFGGSDESGDEDDSDDSDSSETETDDDDDFGDEDGDGDHDDEDHHDGGGEQFTVPEQAPELSPELMAEIPQDDAGGSAPVPPEVIDSLLGLPEGTIEQLLLEEAQQGQGGDPGMSGAPMPPEGGAPQGGGDDFFGGGGDDPEQEPPRMAARRRRVAKDYGRKCSECKSNNTDYSPSTNDYDCYDCGATFKPYSNSKKSPEKESRLRQARQFWAADDEQQSGGESEGGGEQQAPQEDPAAMGGMDPNAMMGGGQMMPPPGSQAVQPPQPPMPLENQPAEDALLDTANQAIMQMIDRETAEYQQIIGPLSQALQAVQFAQQVEQAEAPMDVTPPGGTVNVNPSAAPGGSQNPMQQTAARLQHLTRQAKIQRTLRGAAKVIANTYGVSERMLIEAMGRRQYEHVAEAFRILPPEALQTPEVRAAASHIGKMFGAENQMFNHDIWMDSVVGPSAMARAAGTARDRYQDKAYSGPRDKRRNEHGQQDLADAQAEDEQNHWEDDPEYRKLYQGSRGRLPFDQARTAGLRQAGETWKNTPTMDAFEHPKAGQTPEITDNLTINDLPQHQFKGLPKPKKNSRKVALDLGTKVQRWLQKQNEQGLNTGGDPMAEKYLQTHKVGPRGEQAVHQAVGVPEHPYVQEPPNPRANPAKAVNPVTKRGTWGEWEPTKEASFFTRKVPGWRWDDHLNGYISKEGKAFTCSCGQKIAAPSYKSCDCGKLWNVYAIGDTHHLASDSADMFIAREIPVRPGVVMANKKMATSLGLEGYPIVHRPGDRVVHHKEGLPGTVVSVGPPMQDPGTRAVEVKLDAGGTHHGVAAYWVPESDWTPREDEDFDYQRHLREGAVANKKMAGGYGFADEDDADLVETLYYRERKRNPKFREQFPSFEDYQGYQPPVDEGYDPHGGEMPGYRPPGGTVAKKSQRELVAEIDKLADWTKYDSPDPINEMGKSKPASTTVSKPPKDWATRLPAGDPSKKGGTWTPPSIPRKKK